MDISFNSRQFSAVSCQQKPIADQGQWVVAGGPANLVIVDWDGSWVPQRFHSKSANSPFKGVELSGVVKATIFGGRLTFLDGEVCDPGPVRPPAVGSEDRRVSS